MPQPLTRGVDRAVSWATTLGRTRAWLWTAALLTGIGLCARLAGAHYSFAALFLLPTALAAWSLGAGAGLAAGIAGSVISTSINGLGPTFAPLAGSPSSVAAGWNLAMRGLAVFVIVMLVAGFRRTFDIERWRAGHDALTGALNKQAFLREFDGATRAQARRRSAVFALAYIDLDGFKQVNDAHGHAAGDEVLARFAAGAAALMRRHDLLARFGGDEFVILIAARNSAEALKAIERVHHRLSVLLQDMEYQVSCSMGAVICDESCHIDSSALIGLADALMYEVKRSGRNALRIAIAGDDNDGGGLDDKVEIAA